MDTTTIALKKLHAIVVETTVPSKTKTANLAYALTFNAMLMNLGFILSEEAFGYFSQLSGRKLATLSDEVLKVLAKLKGSHVQHRPMYPNFPQQVIDTAYIELYLNAIMHYYSAGQWLPHSDVLPRELAFEAIKFQPIDIIDRASFRALFTTLLQSNDSLSADDKAISYWFMQQEDADSLVVPEVIPFQENKCLVAAHWLKQQRDITPLVKSATDILRIVTYMAEGDVSLAANTRFPSLPRSMRRTLTKQLERVINEDDIARHRNKWVCLFHNLHVGDYSTKVFKIAKKARGKKPLKSFYGQLEAALRKRDLTTALSLLKSRPGEFGRRLDHVLRIAVALDNNTDVTVKQAKAFTHLGNLKNLLNTATQGNKNSQQVITAFLQIVDAIPTRNLTQLYGHLNTRNHDSYEKMIFPKGSFQRAIIVESYTAALESDLLVALKKGIQQSLQQRFALLEPLGKVWLDPLLIDCPLPSQQRSASEGLFNVARGTRLPLEPLAVLDNDETKDTLRLFVYWVGRDIDLSASFHDENGRMIEQVSYTHLKSDRYQAYHSGDITSAKKGASEFVDINLPAAAEHARYLAMNVLVYSGVNFAEHETCFVGWMTRAKPNSNEIYEPKTVQQKLDLTQECRNVIPVVFDLQQRKAIWTDLPTSRNGFYYNNNVENNYASIEQKLNAMVNTQHKLSLYELLELHAQARGELVETRDEADMVFAFDGTVTPFDVNTINAEYVV